MKNFTCKLVVLLALIVLATSRPANAQVGFNKTQALQLITENAAGLGLSKSDLANVRVSDAYYDKTANVNLVYIQQMYLGVPVYHSIQTLAFRNGKPVSVAGSFVTKATEKASMTTAAPVIQAPAAVAAAAKHVNLPITETIVANGMDANQKIQFASYNVSKENITAKLLWVPTDDDRLVLSWQVKFLPVNTSDYWLINVDAKDGNVVSKDNLTVYETFDHAYNANAEVDEDAGQHKAYTPGTYNTTSTNSTSALYRVLPFPYESPSHGPYSTVTDPFNMAGPTNPITALGWHSDGTTDYNYTRGNNVWAREDRVNNNGSPTPGRSPISPTSLPSLTFDYNFDESQAPTVTSNQNFAITQLFYWNNIMHDVTYQYGFDEVAGNFQANNLGRGGSGNDHVIADAQDGGGTNNANFATPDDGSNPRMQMYLWSSNSTRRVKVNTPGSIFGYKTSAESAVSTANKLANVGGVTANVAMYGTAGNNTGCTAVGGTPLSGKIAVIDQTSACTFPVQIKNAQLAGAVGVIVVKNSAGAPTAMSGTDNTITIPAVMVTQADGTAIVTGIQNGEALNISLNAIQGIDGDLDNGVMAHEYGHGISNRLTGGPSETSCLTNREQMGEGWSDYMALMTTTNWQTAQLTDGPKPRPIGTYVFGQMTSGAGIRTYPYSTDMTINPWTFARLATNTSGQVHTIGEIWATTLWDMTWNIIQMNGINPDLYNSASNGGNSVAFKLVMTGMKLQACRPGFLDGRDAILKADSLLFNGQYSCAIWKAFAKRGMGIKAKQGSSNSYTDQTADFTVPDAVLRKIVDKGIADMNEDLTYTLNVTCRCTPISNYKVVDTINTNLVTYVSGGTFDAVNKTVSFTVPSLSEGQSQTFNFVVKVKPGTYSAPVTPLNEAVVSAAIPSTFTATATGSGAWSVSSARAVSGTFSLKAANPATASTQTLTSVGQFTPTGISTLSFSHYFSTERFYDGGAVELSINNGITWFDAGPYMFENGYNSNIGTDSRAGFAGESGGQFIVTKINLSSFAGKSVKIRFVFSSDAGLGGDGWYIDDIVLKNQAGVYNVGKLFNASNVLVNNSDTSTLITNVLPLKWGTFTATKDANVGLLRWTTLQEQNTAFFEVQRSTDGVEYKTIATQRAAGNSSSELTYKANDATPAKGVNYYRIKQIDRDGNFTYSVVRSLTFDRVNAAVTLTPNPAKDFIVVTAPGNKGTLQVNIFSAKGDKVGSFTAKGEYTKLQLPKYASGVYFVSINGDGVQQSSKLVIE